MEDQKLTQSLLNTISNIKGYGSFYSSGKHDYIIPRLKIGSEIEVSLPLQKDTAKKLINYAVQAPYGKGNETLVDTKVRKTWEIDGSNIVIENPAWNKLLAKIVNKVKEDFSLREMDVHPHLYKLLIYEKGGFFLKHKDTEKEEGMFASLIINLPSEFTGGELEIEWNGESKMIDFSKHQFDISFAAFYTDCDHEVHPIKSGYRISLVYNLVKADNGMQVGLSTMPKAVDEISETLLQLGKNKNDKPFLYLLEHQYTPTNFAIKRLKNNDINRSTVILQAAKKAGYFADLGLLSHHIDGELDYDSYGNFDYQDDIDTSTLTMSAIIDEYIEIGDWLGEIYPAIKRLKLNEVEIINNRNYKDLEEAIESYAEGYMGNYGPSIEYDYHIGAIIMTPFHSIGKLIENATRPILIGWIDHFFKNGIKNVDFNDLIDKFLSIDSRNDYWNKGYLNVLVDCITQNVLQTNKSALLDYIAENIQAVSPKKAVILFESVDNKDVSRILLKSLNNDKLTNLLTVFKAFFNMEKMSTVTRPNILRNYSEFIFNSAALIFKPKKNFQIHSKNNEVIVSKILTTLLKISDHLSINNYIEYKFSKNIDRKFVHDILAPIVLKTLANKNDLWKFYYRTVIDILKFNTKVIPLKPVDWKREFNYKGEIDTQLEILKEFLQDKDKESHIYAKAQEYRTNMEYLIDHLELDISYVTVKKGSPHQLHLTKNENSFESKLKKFEIDTKMLEVFESIS